MGCTCTQQKQKSNENPRAQNYLAKDLPTNKPPEDKNKSPPKAQQQQRQLKHQNGPKRAEIQSEIYLRPQDIVELVFKDEQKFINIIKSNSIKNLVVFQGYDAQPPIVLKTGAKANTTTWNPLVTALVLGKEDIFNYIYKDLNFNLHMLLRDPSSFAVDESPRNNSSPFKTIFNLMVDNDSKLIKVLVNELAYLFDNNDLKKLIEIMQKSDISTKCLEILLQSKAFKQLYFQKVKTVIKYKSGFKEFFEKYLDKFTKQRENVELLQKYLVTSPYCAGFGFYLIEEYKHCKGLFSLSPQALVQKCHDFKDYDVYRISEKYTESEQSEFVKKIQKNILQDGDTNFLSFLDSFQKQVQKKDQMDQKIQTMFQKIVKGDLSGMKGRIGNSDIPKEALNYIIGLKLEGQTIKVESLGDTYEIETPELNALELACAFGHHKLVTYLIDELQLKSPRDFQMQNKGGLIDAMQFIVCPILRKDATNLKSLLNLYHLWTYDQYLAILALLKQTKWFDGIVIALDSKTATHLFFNSALQERFRFIRDHLILPFKLDVLEQSLSEVSPLKEDLPRSSSSKIIQSSKKNSNALSNDEKLRLRELIKNRLTQAPYCAAFLFQEFAQRRDTYRAVAENDQIPETTDQIIHFMTQSIENIDNYELHEYIIQTNGGLINIFQAYLNQVSMNDELKKEQKEVILSEFDGFIKRLNDHPTIKCLRSQHNNNEEVENQI